MFRIKNALTFVVIVISAFVATAQSKKVLLKQVESLKASNDSLSNLIIPQQKLLSEKDTFSYAMAIELYNNNLKQQGLDTAMNMDAFYLGLKNAESKLDTTSAVMRQTAIQKTFALIEARQRALQELEEQKKMAKANENLEKGKAFLAANAKKEGVVSLPSGLQYKVISSSDKSNKKKPTGTDQVKVHYRGSLLDGTVFDASYDRGTPATFGVNQVIKGWTEILQLMSEGDKWEVYIPSDLAYGARGSRALIGPNETLIFTIELLQVNP